MAFTESTFVLWTPVLPRSCRLFLVVLLVRIWRLYACERLMLPLPRTRKRFFAPLAKPPVCRIMDFGKFKYREAKRAHEAKLKLKQIQVKEVKFRPGTDEGDYKIKLRNLIRFLGEGDKAKVTLRFRGREMAHQEFGIRLLERIRGDLEPHAIVEQFPRLEGRQMVMLLAPKKVAVKPHHPNKPEAGQAPTQKAQKASPPESTAVGSK